MSLLPLPSDARTRAADLYQQHSETVAARLAARFPGTDGPLIADAIVEAVLDLSQHPERFDPAKGTVAHFLFGAARRFIIKARRRDERRRLREEKIWPGGVTNSAAAGRVLLDHLIRKERLEMARAFLVRAEEELSAFDLWFRGEDDPDLWSQALDMPGRPANDVLARAERVRARFRQRLHRFLERLAREDQEP